MIVNVLKFYYEMCKNDIVFVLFFPGNLGEI